MNKHALGVALALVGTLIISVAIGLKYSQAAFLFALVAAACAPIVIHRVTHQHWVIAGLIGLSNFASFPLRKLFQIDGAMHQIAVTLAYGAILWLIGFGWKRDWH